MESTAVQHRRLHFDGIDVFYREAGPADAPVILLPHGYPCSSYEFRNFMPALADRWRLLAPDFSGCGYSSTPASFAYTFDGFAAFGRFLDTLRVERFVLYLHDFGSQIGLRVAIQRLASIAALIVQNGDIYEDQLGPKYAALKAYWANPTCEGQAVALTRTFLARAGPTPPGGLVNIGRSGASRTVCV